MTVSSAQNKVSYAGDGSTTVFSVPFLFQANADITAILRDGQGAETTWVEGTDYTLTGAGNPSGGTLTATATPATGEKLTIKRVVPLKQETDYPEGGQFPAQSHEDALDRGTMADQQLQEQIDRTVKLKATSALSNIDFPEPGAGEVVKWNAGGTALETKKAADLGVAIIGTDVQAQDAELQAIADLVSAADRVPYFTGSGAAALAVFTAAGRAIIDDVNAAAQRVTMGVEIGVNVQAFDAFTAFLDTVQEWTRAQNFNATTLTDAANITWDAQLNQVASVTLAGNRTLDNPTNMKDGATYILTVKQDATGSRTLSFGSAYKFPGGTAPTLTAAANAVDILTFVSDGTNMYAVSQLDFK